jgi:LmbE family N-acetylglucosaminyl deacetylase
MVEPRADTDNIYLSPHFDDAAFSLGALIASGRGGVLVNLFTRSAYVAAGSPDATPEVVDRISALRDAEDLAFAQRHGLRRIVLGADEPKLRGRDPFDAKGLDEDVAQIGDRLASTLTELVTDGRSHRVFAPIGIGGHVNHLAVRDVVLSWVEHAPPEIEVYFYEDLHYASRWINRHAGLRHLATAAGDRRLVRHAWPAQQSKLDDINLYTSQHHRPVRSLRRFSPAALWPLHPHEAAWELIRQRKLNRASPTPAAR